jgi:toxin ParE1/3/4
MATVSWTIEALEDVASIRAYIAQFDRHAAAKVAAKLLGAGDGLSSFPERGPVASAGTRKLSIVWPYILQYRVHDGNVVILGVRHGARLPEERGG